MKSIAGVALAAVMACAGQAVSAEAAPITRSYEFSASFSDAPISVIEGRFSATFDPQIDVNAGSVSSFSSNLPEAYLPPKVTYANTQVIVGNDCDLGCVVHSNLNEFFLVFLVNTKGDVIGVEDLVYASVETPHETYVSASLKVTSVPLPSSAPLFGAALLGLGAVGYGMKRRGQARPA